MPTWQAHAKAQYSTPLSLRLSCCCLLDPVILKHAQGCPTNLSLLSKILAFPQVQVSHCDAPTMKSTDLSCGWVSLGGLSQLLW